VDYRGLNKVTVKNRYPLPLISEILDRISGAQYFSKIDIKDAYYRIRIQEGDEWKTAFRTRHGHYEYLVMPFGLANTPATFQSYMHTALRGLLDDFCIAYFDDILIFSADRDSHTRHIKVALGRLRKAQLHTKPSKSFFCAQEVKGFVLSFASGDSAAGTHLWDICECSPGCRRRSIRPLKLAGYRPLFILAVDPGIGTAVEGLGCDFHASSLRRELRFLALSSRLVGCSIPKGSGLVRCGILKGTGWYVSLWPPPKELYSGSFRHCIRVIQTLYPINRSSQRKRYGRSQDHQSYGTMGKRGRSASLSTAFGRRHTYTLTPYAGDAVPMEHCSR